jgi:hypothetical protein
VLLVNQLVEVRVVFYNANDESIWVKPGFIGWTAACQMEYVVAHHEPFWIVAVKFWRVINKPENVPLLEMPPPMPASFTYQWAKADGSTEQKEKELLRLNLERLAARWGYCRVLRPGNGDPYLRGLYDNGMKACLELRRVLAGESPPKPGEEWEVKE